jgi:NAD(P)-dependent dehydrogenase (short-subunit alcohol dehydrogenase family)
MFFIARHTDPMFRLSSGLQRMIVQGIRVTRRFSVMALVMSIFLKYHLRMNVRFEGKKAVVVGGSGGLGRPLVDALVAGQASVLSVGRHAVPGVESAVVNLDMPEDRRRVLEIAAKADILCCVRGPFLQKPLAETGEDEWNDIVFANLTYPGQLVSAALPHMVASGWGRILLFGGTRTDSIRGVRTNAAYAAAKTGLSALAKSTALAYASRGITCNVLCPGLVDTEYLEKGLKEALAVKNPDGKLISAGAVAESAMFLLENDICNGVVLPVDKAWDTVLI